MSMTVVSPDIFKVRSTIPAAVPSSPAFSQAPPLEVTGTMAGPMHMAVQWRLNAHGFTSRGLLAVARFASWGGYGMMEIPTTTWGVDPGPRSIAPWLEREGERDSPNTAKHEMDRARHEKRSREATTEMKEP
jgi:hypothetical protein